MFESLAPTQRQFLTKKDIDLSTTESLDIRIRSDFREEWLTRLRSGAYHQTMKRLHKVVKGQHSFCCLGLMCDIATVTLPDAKWGDLLPGYTDVLFYSDGDAGRGIMPPDSLIRRWFPKDHAKAELFTSRLALCNDDGFSFEQIADLIEFHTVGHHV